MWRRFEALPRVRSSLASHTESQRNQHKRTLFAQPANQLFAVVCGFPPALDDVRNLLFGSHYSGAHRGASSAVPRGGGDSTVNQEITAGEKAAVQNHEQRADRSHFVWSAGASSRGLVDHAAVPSPRGRVSSSFARGVVSLRSVRLLNPPGWLSSHVASRPLVAGESNPVQRRLGIAAS